MKRYSHSPLPGLLALAASSLLMASLVLAQAPQKKTASQKPAPAKPAAAKPAPAPAAAPAPVPAEPLGTKAVTRADLVKNPDSALKGRKLAVLVAISDYKESITKLPNLKYTTNDVVSVAAALKDQGYQVKILQEADATAAQIRSTVKETLGMFTKPDESTFLFYFTGHGFAIEKENYLATFGVSADNLQQQGLPVKELTEMLDDSGVRQRMAILDACRNDPDKKAVGLNRSIEKFDRARGTKIMFSTAPGQYSYEVPNLQQGLFTHFFLEGLKGGAAGPDGFISWGDLKDFIENQMVEFSMSQNTRSQIPYTTGESTGDFLLGRRPEGYKPPSAKPVLSALPPTPAPAAPTPAPTGDLTPAARLGDAGTIRSIKDTWQSSLHQGANINFKIDEDNIFVFNGETLLGTLEAKRDKKTNKVKNYDGKVRLAPATGCPDGQGRMLVTSITPNVIKARIENPTKDKAGAINCGAFTLGFAALIGPEVTFVKKAQ